MYINDRPCETVNLEKVGWCLFGDLQFTKNFAQVGLDV